MGAPKNTITVMRIMSIVVIALYPLHKLHKRLCAPCQITQCDCTVTHRDNQFEHPNLHVEKGNNRSHLILIADELDGCIKEQQTDNGGEETCDDLYNIFWSLLKDALGQVYPDMLSLTGCYGGA
jgi:hypothetical protein